MNEFGSQVESKIPVPKVADRKRYLVLDTLEPGESVLIPGLNTTSVKSSLWYRQERDGKKFTARKVEGGVRVWRVA